MNCTNVVFLLSAVLSSGGAFATLQFSLGGFPASTPSWLAVGDFNRDGLPDIAVASGSSVEV